MSFIQAAIGLSFCHVMLKWTKNILGHSHIFSSLLHSHNKKPHASNNKRVAFSTSLQHILSCCKTAPWPVLEKPEAEVVQGRGCETTVCSKPVEHHIRFVVKGGGGGRIRSTTSKRNTKGSFPAIVRGIRESTSAVFFWLHHHVSPSWCSTMVRRLTSAVDVPAGVDPAADLRAPEDCQSLIYLVIQSQI